LEQAYGSSLEAWRDSLQFQGQDISVELLRVGRVGMYFQSLDGTTSAYWDNELDDWVVLDEGYNRPLLQAIRVARNLTAPQLLQLPLQAPGGES
jgi:hypothetical protein